MRKIIVNSTPIISLANISKLDLLKELYGKIYIPYGVYEEVSFEGKSKIGDDLINKGIYVDDKIYKKVLELAGENK